MSVLIVAPSGTALTLYTLGMAQQLHQRLLSHPTKQPMVGFLGDPLATQPTFGASRMVVGINKDGGKDTIIYFGHGTPESLVGTPIVGISFSPSNMVVAGLNDQMLQDAVVITISCKSLGGLGRRAVTGGALAFAGSTEDMWVGHDQNGYDYLADFTKVFLSLPTGFLLDGLTLGQATQVYKTLAQRYVDRYESMGGPTALKHAKYMKDNIKYYNVVGNKDVRYYG